MGAVVAVRDGSRIYMATDRAKQRQGLYWHTTAEFNFKIHKLKNGVIIGAIGPLLQVQRLYLHEEWFRPPKGVPFDKRFIVRSIIPKYVDCLKANNLLEKRDSTATDYPHTESAFIIVNGGDMFLIDADFGVYVMKDLAIITNSGQTDVFNSLAFVTDRSDSERFLTVLFERAAKALSDISPQIVLIDTENTMFRFAGGTK